MTVSEGAAGDTVAAVLCTRCGLANPPGERFCRSCSAFLEWSGREVAAPPPPPVVEAEPEAEVHQRLIERARDWAFFGETPPPPPVELADETAAAVAAAAEAASHTEVVAKVLDVSPTPVKPEEPTTERVIVPLVVVDPSEGVGLTTPCPTCATANEEGRTFCRRCGAIMEAPPPPPRLSRWQRHRRRVITRREAKQSLPLGHRPKVRRQLVGGVQAGWLTSAAAGAFGLVGMVMLGLAFVGPLSQPIKSHVGQWATDVREFVRPHYTPEYPYTATASTALSGHPAIDAIDGNTSTYWAASGPALGETLTMKFGKPVAIGRIGFLIGDQDPVAAYLNQPRPSLVHVAFSDGSSADLSLADSSSFQAFSVDAKKIKSVQVTIESIYQSQAGSNVSITEIEFFKKS
jgi:predicted nucleic acid-binding Zn ribbon protein